MSRVPGWQAHLEAAFRIAQKSEFKWGSYDCCQFALGCIWTVSGVDLSRHFATYDSEAGAWGILQALGGMQNLLIYALGEPKPVAFACVGDIVLIDMGRGEQPAVCMGVDSFAPGPRGLVPRRTALARVAWTV